MPNLTFGAPVVKCLRKKLPDAFFDCHLMVAKPEDFVDDFANAGADQFTFHYEVAQGISFTSLSFRVNSELL